MSATEAARIAAVLPLPKKRGATAPKGFTRRYGNTIAARLGVVGRNGLDSCVYRGTTAPADKAPPRVSTKPRPLPGEEYETARPLPPAEAPEPETPPPSTETAADPLPVPPSSTNESAPPEQPDEPVNQF
jgi:monofunctional biosynthetic peptidoglycan transglycosylase